MQSANGHTRSSIENCLVIAMDRLKNSSNFLAINDLPFEALLRRISDLRLTGVAFIEPEEYYFWRFRIEKSDCLRMDCEILLKGS